MGIYFTAVGMLKVFTEDEIVAMMEEIGNTTALQHKKKRCNLFSRLHRNLHRNYFLMGLAHYPFTSSFFDRQGALRGKRGGIRSHIQARLKALPLQDGGKT